MTTEEPIDQPGQPESYSRPPALMIDWELYGRYLADSDLPDAEKRLLIETLWSIIVSFVDLGFRLGPIKNSCGQAAAPDSEATAAGRPVLDCKDITATQAFEGAVADAPATSSTRRPHGS